ncbi:MAG: hypothetical protein ACYDBY_14490 [Thermoanaerobaculia bacterium]
MTDEMQQRPPQAGYEEPFEPPPPTFGDAVRYVWERRVRLVRYLAVFLALGLVSVVAWFFARERLAEATLSLGFKGIEKAEYPNGRKFDIADFRGPKVLRAAVREIGKEKSFPSIEQVARGVQAQPVIPGEVQARWKKQDKDGKPREEFFPSSFRVQARPEGMSAEESVQLLYAMLTAYQQEVKYEQLGALKFMGEVARYRPDELIRLYDYWDLPRILGENVAVLRENVRGLTAEAKDFRDPKFNVSFQDLEQDLSVWTSTRLQNLRGLVDGDRLVKDRTAMAKRLEVRRWQVEIQIRGVTQELAEATKLLESVDRPRTTLAGPLSGNDGMPVIDTNALDRLVASDYVGGVVKRVTALQQEKTRLQEQMWTTERDLELLANAKDVPLEKLPPAFERELGLVTTDLARILDSYNKLLSSYLDATVTSQVTLRDGPRVVRPGPSTVVVLAAVLFVCVALAFVLLVVGDSVRKAMVRPG